MDERFEIHGFASASDVAARALRCLMAGVLILLVMWIPAGNAYAEGEYYEEGEALGTDEEAQESSDDAGKEASVEMVAMESNATSVDRAPENIVDPTQRADNSFIYDTSISSLFEESSLHDGQIVQVEGEVIGDRIVNTRGEGYWIEVSSLEEGDTSNISVLVTAEQVALIDSYGRYGVTGTTLRVRGEYHQACREHDGQSDVHATSASVVARGENHPDAFDPNKLVPGILLTVLGAGLGAVYYALNKNAR